MILETIFNFIYGVAYFLMALVALPVAMFQDIATKILDLTDFLATIGYWVPLSAVGIAISVYVQVRTFQLAWYGMNWLIRKIPGVS